MSKRLLQITGTGLLTTSIVFAAGLAKPSLPKPRRTGLLLVSDGLVLGSSH